eukprot:TRINITY_DN2122_c0_g1_i4.p1 TRINITY_DN2122_c0_g1~~TRINITY_DN2122_c0_g1_i4.p1  ORF type:complete len:366 (+),score=50.28 TRINITY_DN2122_c0_g1_i4:1234-2331(+)
MGCSHPGGWKYDHVALLYAYENINRESKRLTWRFSPPLIVNGKGYAEATSVQMSDQTYLECGDCVFWTCIGNSSHYVDLFVSRGFDVVVSENIEKCCRKIDLSGLYSDLLDSKKANGYSIPFSFGGIGSEWPPVLVFERGALMRKCLSCAVRENETSYLSSSHHWSWSFKQRLAEAKDLIVGGISISELEQQDQCKRIVIRSPGSTKPLSYLNQDADLIACVIQWGAIGFLKEFGKHVDMQKRNSGCPVYFFKTTLKALEEQIVGGDVVEKGELIKAALALLTTSPSNVVTLTAGCVSRQEDTSDIEEAICSLLKAVPKHLIHNFQAHRHLKFSDSLPCVWCTSLANESKKLTPPSPYLSSNSEG